PSPRTGARRRRGGREPSAAGLPSIRRWRSLGRISALPKRIDGDTRCSSRKDVEFGGVPGRWQALRRTTPPPPRDRPRPERFTRFQAPDQDSKGLVRAPGRTLAPSILTPGDAAMSAVLSPSIHLIPTPKPAGVASVALRVIRPDDAAALQAFVRALSPVSRRLRFHMALHELTESGLNALTRVDQRAHVAFVLTTTQRGVERIVGEARYVVSCDKETAEFAIAVAEGFRGLGLAERLGGAPAP